MFTINRYEYRNTTYKGTLDVDEDYLREINDWLEEDYDLPADFKPITAEDIRDFMNSNSKRYEEKIVAKDSGSEYYLMDEIWDKIDEDLWYVNFIPIDNETVDYEDCVED